MQGLISVKIMDRPSQAKSATLMPDAFKIGSMGNYHLLARAPMINIYVLTDEVCTDTISRGVYAQTIAFFCCSALVPAILPSFSSYFQVIRIITIAMRSFYV